MTEDETGYGANYVPKFFSMLDEKDQNHYRRLRTALSSHICRNRRGKRLETFAEKLATIYQFCVRGNDSDWRRCLVCGVCWIPNGIAVNTRQLGILIDKCKSSINGSLQKMGYSTLQSRSDSAAAVAEAIPALKDDFAELREWTVRLFVAQTPQPTLQVYNVNTVYRFASPAPHSGQYYGYPANPKPFWESVPQQMTQQPVVSPPQVPLSPQNHQAKQRRHKLKPVEQEPSESDQFTVNVATSNEDKDLLADPFDDGFCLTPSFLADDKGSDDLFRDLFD